MKIKIFLLALLVCLNSAIYSQSQKEKFYQAIVNGDIEQQHKIAANLTSSYSNFTYSYFELLLNSLPNKAILIANSLDDSYPIKILQLNRNIRTDVQVISLKMLADSSYVSTINNDYGLKIRNESTRLQVKSIFSSSKNAFFSSTVKATYWYHPTYFISGLYLQLGSQNNSKRLDAFYKEFSELKLKPQKLTSNDKLLIKNLLPPLITLYKNGNKSSSLKNDILIIADIAGNRETVTAILDSD